MIKSSFQVTKLCALRRSFISLSRRNTQRCCFVSTTGNTPRTAPDSDEEDSMFDPLIIRKGIAWEEDKGFVNTLGRSAISFQEFLIRNLETLEKDPNKTPAKTKLGAYQIEVRKYDSMGKAERKRLCNKVLSLIDELPVVEESNESARPPQPVIKTIEPRLDPIPGYTLIGFDLETNGFMGDEKYQVLEMAAMNFSSGEIFHSLINPGRRIRWNREAEEKHQITEDMVMNDAVLKWDLVWEKFVDWVEREAADRKVVLVAHNGMVFDFRVVLRKTSGTLKSNWWFFDTLIYARYLRRKKLVFGRVALSELVREFNVDIYGNAHQADADVVHLGTVLKRLSEKEGCSVADLLTSAMETDIQWCQHGGTFLAKLHGVPIKSTTQRRVPSRPKSQKEIVRDRTPVREEPEQPVTTPYDTRASASLSQEVAKLKMYKPGVRKKLEASGFSSLLDILKHLPREYVPLTDFSPMPSPDESVVIKCTVVDACAVKGKMSLIQWRFKTVSATQPWIVSTTQFLGNTRVGQFVMYKFIRQFPVGSQVILLGKPSYCYPDSRLCDMTLSTLLSPEEFTHVSLLPIYPSRKLIKADLFPKIISEAIGVVAPLVSVGGTVPSQKYSVDSWLSALLTLHRPINLEALKNAQHTIKFYDLISLHTLLISKNNQQALADVFDSYVVNGRDKVDVLLEAFEHELTNDQQTCLCDILDDMKGIRPMIRILQGDVGTGKTIIAFLAMFAVYGSGLQAAMMAPSEILCHQHFSTLSQLLQSCPSESRPRIALLTSATKPTERREIVDELKTGVLDLLIGTHALVQKDIQFRNLALTVIDEQHKFGVEQRQRLKQQYTTVPHMLMLSATPIPRSMAMICFNTTSISTIKTPIPGKKDIRTFLLWEDDVAEVEKMYEFVKQDLKDGGRVYVVYPCIDESEHESFTHLKAATTEFKRLSTTRFSEFQCGLVHGRMASQDKTEAFSKFESGETQVLISTSVIEVGVDVHEASVMIVFHPERFGLATLHQLRGRVGRGRRESSCFLVHRESVERLRVLMESSDGEEIAATDLRQRGPGDLLGFEQSGFKTCMTFPWKQTFSEIDMIIESRTAAEELMQEYRGELPEEFTEMMRVQGFPSVDDFDI